MKVLLLKKDGVSIEGEFKALNESYIDKIMDFQQEIIDGLEEKEWYSPSTKEEFLEILKKGRILGCVLEDDSLIAISVYINWGYEQYNYGYDLNIKGEDLLRVGQIESTLVKEEFRGNRLQRKMCMILEETSKKSGDRIISATASPYNIYSVNTFKALGYSIEDDKLKYGGLRRYVFKKVIQ